MNKLILSLLIPAAIVIGSGCVADFGGGTTTHVNKPTVGQQLLDLQRAKDAGAISEPEYEAQKAKILHDN